MILNTEFIGIFVNGLTIKKSHLNDLLQVQYVKYMLKVVNAKSEFNNYYYDSITLIDRNGAQTQLTIGDFTLVDIADGGWAIIILDVRRNTIHRLKTESKSERFIQDEVIPLLDCLNGFGSYKAYEVGLKNRELVGEIEVLKLKIKQLESQIHEEQA